MAIPLQNLSAKDTKRSMIGCVLTKTVRNRSQQQRQKEELVEV